MKYRAITATRGDTIKVPVLVTIPSGVTIRIHLRETAESDTFYNLSIVSGNVVIPEVISAACLGVWGFDIELTDALGAVETVQRVSITFEEDYSRVYGAEATDLLSDLERRVIIAKEFKFRKLDNTLEGIPSLEDMTAITAAEALRVIAESARVSAEALRVTAAQSQATAEGLRVSAEEARVTAEGLRVASEQGRVTAEGLRVTAEGLRVQAEQARVTAEGLRVSAEEARVTAEGLRVTAENARVLAEQGRVSVEALRVTAEEARVTAEGLRVTAESARVTAEGLRATAESTRQSQETARQASEANRVSLTIQQRPIGLWNAATNTPALANGTGTIGSWYVCQVAGTFNSEGYVPGDAVWCNQSVAWVRIPKQFLNPNNAWWQSYDYAGNLVNTWRYNADNEFEWASPIKIAALRHVANQGFVDIVDIPVTAASPAGTIHGVGVVVAGVRLLEVVGKSDGAGSITGGYIKIPAVTTTQRDAIPSPSEGMIVFNLTTHVLNFYNGTIWGAV